MNPSRIEVFGTLFFALAILHTFFAARILKFSHRFPAGTGRARLFHLLGEVELVFALWGTLLMVAYILSEGWAAAMAYQDSLHFIEPIFIFVIMVVASTKPILFCARIAIQSLSSGLQKIFKMPQVSADLLTVLTIGPLSGSFITEPAAMTVTAFLLLSMLKERAEKLIYPLLAVLFVNVSIGGALTHFAAPPILMVAHKWNWDLAFVFTHFGWKSALAVLVNALGLLLVFRKNLSHECRPLPKSFERIPGFVNISHLFFLLLVILTSHHQNAFVGVFLLFLGLIFLTRDYHENLRLKEGLLVAIFLGGIIIFGTFQSWWLTPLLTQLSGTLLFGSAVVLTAFTDNAALTYLGAQVPHLAEASRYALVAGALSGGGLTLIANAPNAAGFTILSKYLPDGLQPARLLKAALLPTLVACGFLFL